MDLANWRSVQPHIAGKGSRSQVVVVGESTARGYLLEPALTPALALATLLGQADRYQCVDLAKTGAKTGAKTDPKTDPKAGVEIREHASLIAKLPLSETDWLVLLTGTSWTLPALGVNDLDYLANAVRSGGAATLRTAVRERLLAPGIQTLLDAVQAVHDRHGVRVIVVVPEFNQVTGLLSTHTPRVTRYGQDVLRGFAATNGHALVDLTTELADPATGLPDPGCFLDYCHLSAVGMGRAMAAVADRLRAAG